MTTQNTFSSKKEEEEYALFLSLRQKYEPHYQQILQNERKKMLIDFDTYCKQRSEKETKAFFDKNGKYLAYKTEHLAERMYNNLLYPYSDLLKEEWDQMIAILETDYGKVIF